MRRSPDFHERGDSSGGGGGRDLDDMRPGGLRLTNRGVASDLSLPVAVNRESEYGLKKAFVSCVSVVELHIVALEVGGVWQGCEFDAIHIPVLLFAPRFDWSSFIDLNVPTFVSCATFYVPMCCGFTSPEILGSISVSAGEEGRHGPAIGTPLVLHVHAGLYVGRGGRARISSGGERQHR